MVNVGIASVTSCSVSVSAQQPNPIGNQHDLHIRSWPSLLKRLACSEGTLLAL
jgi:hypothetical protein